MQNLKTIEELEKEATKIYGYVNQTIPDDISILPDLGASLLEYYSRSGELMAQAKIYLNRAVKYSIISNKDKNLSPAIFKEFIKADIEREQYLFDLIERTNRACIHSVDFIRTLISKSKSEIQYQNFRK